MCLKQQVESRGKAILIPHVRDATSCIFLRISKNDRSRFADVVIEAFGNDWCLQKHSSFIMSANRVLGARGIPFCWNESRRQRAHRLYHRQVEVLNGDHIQI